MFGRQFGNFLQHCSTSLGKNELGVTAIFGAALPFDQSPFRQLINQHDHAAREHPQFLRQCPLIARGSSSDDAQDSSMPGCDAQSFDALAKTIGRVRAELSEKKSGTGWPLLARFHKARGQLKEITCEMQSFIL